VNIIWKGPLREDDREQQVQVVENFIARRVSGLVLAPLDARPSSPRSRPRCVAGIPVVIIDSALNSKQPASTVSTDNYKGGVLGARRLGEVLGGKGKVILIRVLAGSNSTEQREAGFLDTIKKEFPRHHRHLQRPARRPTRDTAYRAAQNLLNRFGREVDGIFAPNESSGHRHAAGVARCRPRRRQGEVHRLRQRHPDRAGLKSGDIQGIVVQNPMKMGYLGVKTLVAALRGEKVEREIDTGVRTGHAREHGQPRRRGSAAPPLEKYLK
jgi:ribose transport system substrate-binding protein